MKGGMNGGMSGTARRVMRVPLRAGRHLGASVRRQGQRRRVIEVPGPNGTTLRWRHDDRYPGEMAAGTYEAALVERMAALITPGTNVLDVGANSGYLSLVAKLLTGDRGTVTAVEPHPDNLATIGDRRRLNPGLPIELVAAAVAPAAGEVALHVARNLANGRIEGAGWSHQKASTDVVTVAAITFDDLLARSQAQVVKVDIEGAEAPVLEASGGPDGWATRPVLLVEYHGTDNRDRCARLARKWDYRVEDHAGDDPELPGGLLTMEPVGP